MGTAADLSLEGTTADLLHILVSDIKQARNTKGCVCINVDSHTFLPSPPGSYLLTPLGPTAHRSIFIFLSLRLCP